MVRGLRALALAPSPWSDGHVHGAPTVRPGGAPLSILRQNGVSACAKGSALSVGFAQRAWAQGALAAVLGRRSAVSYYARRGQRQRDGVLIPSPETQEHAKQFNMM